MAYDFTPHLTAIQTFHRAFAHPVGATPAPLPLDRLVTRLTWAMEEIVELALADNEVDAVDALCDCAYFLGGTLVEMGILCFMVLPTYALRSRQHDTFPAFLSRMTRLLMAGTQDETLLDQSSRLREALAELIWYQQRVRRIPFAPIFEIVHQANMDKLWPDGLPRYAQDGKVLKPEGWTPPEARIAAYLTENLPQ